MGHINYVCAGLGIFTLHTEIDSISSNFSPSTHPLIIHSPVRDLYSPYRTYRSVSSNKIPFRTGQKGVFARGFRVANHIKKANAWSSPLKQETGKAFPYTQTAYSSIPSHFLQRPSPYSRRCATQYPRLKSWFGVLWCHNYAKTKKRSQQPSHLIVCVVHATCPQILHSTTRSLPEVEPSLLPLGTARHTSPHYSFEEVSPETSCPLRLPESHCCPDRALRARVWLSRGLY